MNLKKRKSGKRNPNPRSEEEVLSLIVAELPSPSGDVVTGIGDDCAVIRQSGKPAVYDLLKTDALVEGIHFAAGTPLHLIGWKALCRPVSDIAAMGGVPKHALITVAAPATWSKKEWRALYRGIGKGARAFHISIVGGETVRSPGPLFLSVALSGQVERTHLRLRGGARSGDLICVTGKLGASFASGRHLRFHPRLAEGQWLAAQKAVTCMMDLSDGLGSDLPKLARACNTSFQIDHQLLPRHRGSSAEEAISDGEDYELLLCIRPSAWTLLHREWQKEFSTLSLTCIGKLTPKESLSTPITSGYDHFREPLI
jgi:thiamine-monophosphate kinase